MTRIYRPILIALVVTTVGCAHSQLRYDTVRQAQTLTEIYERQVLNNLAMFAENPYALPHFTVANLGTSNVTDSGQVMIPSLEHFRRTIGLQGGRQIAEAWQLDPIRDPRKLTLMRCAYQRAVGFVGDPCVDCCQIQKDWQGTPDEVIHVYDRNGKRFIPDPQTGLPYDLLAPDGQPIFDEAGNLTSSGEKYVDEDGNFTLSQVDCDDPCLPAPGWFCRGCASDVPKELRACFGRYNRTCVWVPPEHRNELTKLALQILDYAVNDPPSPRTKEVVRYLDALGGPATVDDHAQSITMSVPIDEPVEVALTVPEINHEIQQLEMEQHNIEQLLKTEGPAKQELLKKLGLEDVDDVELQKQLFRIQKRLNNLDRAKARIREAKPRGPSARASGGIIGLRLQLDALAPAPPPVLRQP